jgi:ATP-dependent RNA helicase SUPV3L1/SUV3
VSGNRAVRIDILERLADLVRPLLAWRPTPEVPDPPPGVAPRGGFMVTPAMTSLLGCSGDDFASVLRSLGYRVERRAPPPAAAAPAPSAVDATPVDAALAADATNPDAAPAPATVEFDAKADGIADAPPDRPEPSGWGEEPEPAPAPSEPATPAAATAPDGGAVAPEPAFIEIWRPGRPHGERHGGRRTRDSDERPKRVGRADRERRPRSADSQGEKSEPALSRREDRGGRRGRQHERRGDERAPMKLEQKPRKREVDPDSPFAALAALKATLEGRGSE